MNWSTRAALAILAITAVGCLKSHAVTCADGRTCPAEYTCDEIHHGCLSPAQQNACVGQADGMACNVEGMPAGICDAEVCIVACGDGRIELDEECDDPEPVEHSCQELGFYEPGVATCSSTCRFDTSTCKGFCGDGERNGSEICDLAPPDGVSCLDYGFDIGRVSCSPTCTPELSECGQIGWYIDNGYQAVDSFFRAVWGSGANDIFVVGYYGEIVHFDGTTWTQQLPRDTMSSLRELRAVWGTGASDVFAAGAGGEIDHYDGSTWTAQRPFAAGGPRFNAIWGTSSTNIYAVGAGIWHYNGASWTDVTPSAGTGMSFNSVWGTANNIVVVGDAGAILHYDGSWSKVSVPAAAQSDALDGVWGASASDIHVVGQNGTILHSTDGSAATWTVETSGSTGLLVGVWGSSANDVYAISYEGTILRYDGTGWQIQSSDAVGLFGIWGASSSDLIVVGDTTIRRRGALFWSPQTLPADAARLFAVSGTADDDVFAIGDTTSVHFDGAGWVDTAQPARTGAFRSLWVGTNVLVGDNSGSIFSGTRNGADLTWSTLVAAPGPRIRSIWATGTSDVYLAGGTGAWWNAGTTAAAAHWSGTSVSAIGPTIQNDAYHAVWATGASNVFLATARGQVAHYDGAAWSLQQASTQITSLWGAANGDVYAVGRHDVSQYDGAQWSTVGLGNVKVRGITGRGPADLYVSGWSGVIEHSDGTRWVPIRSSTVAPLIGAWASPRSVYFAGGSPGSSKGTMLRLQRSCDANEQRCRDGFDDDCDGLVDCADSDCNGDARCNAGGLCAPAQMIACGDMTTGTTRKGAWRIDTYRHDARPETGPEVFYRFTASSSSSVTVTLSGFAGDLDLLVLPVNASGACDPVAGAVASSSTTAASETVTFAATAGTTYVIAVDGYDKAFGAYQLALSCP